MTETARTTSTSEYREQGGTLQSWKEIAAYLDRDISTVKRWEKHEGLPVRRHLHESRSSVYAHRGGNPNPYLDPELRLLHLVPEEKVALVAFLKALSGKVISGALR